MKNLLFIFNAILLFSSCEKDNIEYDDSALVKQVFFDSELIYEYSYNGGQITEEKSKYYFTRYNYNGSRLISCDHYVDTRIFSSNSSVLDLVRDREEWVNPQNTLKNSTMTYYYGKNSRLIKSSNSDTKYSIYSYDIDSRISRQTFYNNQKRSGYIDYLYDEKGNIIKKLHYFVSDSGAPTLQTTTEYEFDNKHNPFRVFSTFITTGLHTNCNNITKEIYTLHFEVDPFVDKVQVTENVYEYNRLGYPVRKNKTIEYRY